MRNYFRQLLWQHLLVGLIPLLVLGVALLAWSAPGRGPFFLGLVVTCAGAVCAAGYLLARRAAAPVEDLVGDLARLRPGDPSSPVRLGAAEGPEDLTRAIRQLNEYLDDLRRRLQAGETVRAELETVLAQMADGLIVLDERLIIKQVNPAAMSLLWDGQEEPVGRTLLEALPSYPLDAMLRPVLAGDQPAGAVEFRSPDEASRPLRALAARLTSDATAGVCLLIQDLTEVRRVDDMRRDFVANVSHEVKTPVASISALSETLLLRGRDRPELVPELSERIVSECARLGALVDDLLSLSELELGRRETHVEDIPAAEILRALDQGFRSRAETGGQEFRVRQAAPLRVRADRSFLSQALGNLMDNALKYTPVGGVITVSVEPRDGRVDFIIADSGPGIPPEAITRVFERFYRVDQARSRELGGTGLGLSIVKHLVESMGGAVRVESEPGEGSRFILSLPAGPDQASGGA